MIVTCLFFTVDRIHLKITSGWLANVLPSGFIQTHRTSNLFDWYDLGHHYKVHIFLSEPLLIATSAANGR